MPEHCLFHGGVHPDDGKSISCISAIETAPLQETYIVPLQQHIGAPPKLIVEKGQVVLRGQVIAEAGGFVSACIHAPTSGKISKITDCTGPSGTRMAAVEISSDGEDKAEHMPPVADWQDQAPEVLRKRIAAAGVVGMGGAAFPTNVKLSPPPAKKIDTLIINGVECEPCLTADHRLMLEETDKVLSGIAMVARVLNAENVYIGIEGNKPDAVERVKTRAAGTNIKVVSLRVRYPQGAEKQLIYALTGRKVPTGGLPMDVGCVVQNVGTAAAVADAMLEGKPLYERITTVTGSPLVRCANWRVRVGTTVKTLLELCGGVKTDPAKIISGGPMMGMSLYSLDVPVMKNTSGILLLGPSEVAQFTSGPCISCGRCVDTCPMDLMAGTLSVQIENERFELAEAWHVLDCIECGCCAYVCPSHRPMVQHMRRAKSEIMTKRRAAAQKK